MQPEQEIIADWMNRIRKKKGWSWKRWAEETPGIGSDTTLSRAVKPDYKSVTSVPTLHALAMSAEEPSILDFLSGRASIPYERPNPETMAPLVAALIPLLPSGRVTDQSLRALCEALSYGLGLLQDQRSNSPTKDAIGVASRAAIARFRELIAES